MSPRGRRQIPAGSFFQGFWTTGLEGDELLTGVRFPMWTGRCGFGVREFARRHGDFAVAGAVVAVQVDADDRVERCAISLLGLGPTPLRTTAAERAAVGQKPDLDADELGELAMSDLDRGAVRPPRLRSISNARRRGDGDTRLERSDRRGDSWVRSR